MTADHPGTYKRLENHHRIVLLTDGHSTPFLAKTAISLLRYRGADVTAILDSQAEARTAESLFGVGGDIPVVSSLDEIEAKDSLYIGIAPPGGKIPDHWNAIVEAGIRAGMDVVSGLHDFLNERPSLVALARQHGSTLIDVRANRLKQTARHHDFRRENFRVHTVGHDCSVGKMVTTVEVHKALCNLGADAAFVATGQTGIMISGQGAPVDCVVADFVNGAVESLVMEQEVREYTLIEGQGSISHPAFSAVTCGLLHGCAPQALIFCLEAGRATVKGLKQVAIPPLRDQIHAILTMARLRHPCELIGFSINTRNLSEDEAQYEVQRVESEFGLPACDVFRQGPIKLCEAVQSARQRWLES